MEEKKVSKKKMSKGKRAVINLLAVALIIGATVAVTLALLSTTSDEKVNTFTASSDIKLGLDEPNYNLNDDGTLKNDNKPDPSNYQPGTSYDKDPTLYNLSGENLANEEISEEWVAMRVDYQIDDEEKTCEEMSANNISEVEGKVVSGGIINAIPFDLQNWIRITNDKCSAMPSNEKYDIYVYKYKLTAVSGVDSVSEAVQLNDSVASWKDGNAVVGIKTTPLFKPASDTTGNQITIKTQDQLIKNGYATNNLPQFKIILNGGAIKNQTDININYIDSDNLNKNDNATTAEETIVTELVKLLKEITPGS